MKADLYVQGHFWATINVPGDTLLALLAKGLIVEAQQKSDRLKADLEAINGVQCSIHMRIQEPVTYAPATASQDPDQVAP